MAEMKCPWQTIETMNWYEDGGSRKKVEFAACLESDCPFWMRGKFTSPVCYRAMVECGRG